MYIGTHVHLCVYIDEQKKKANMLPIFPAAVLFLTRLSEMLRLDLNLEIRIKYS